MPDYRPDFWRPIIITIAIDLEPDSDQPKQDHAESYTVDIAKCNGELRRQSIK